MKFLNSLLFSMIVFGSAHSDARAFTARSTNMNQDVVIRETLFNALSASAGSVPYVVASLGKVTLAYGNDSLVCSASSCTLTWDSTSPAYSQSAGVFETSLYDVLEKWALGTGANDPATHRTLFPTGSDQIIVSGEPGSTDYVKCSSLRAGPTPLQTCALVLSDYTTDTNIDSENLFNNMASVQTYITPEIQAQLALVSGSNFLPLSDSDGGNGVIQITRTVSTDLLVDELTVAKDFAYVTPVVDNQGLNLSNGITLSLVGTEDTLGNFTVSEVQSSSYALSVIIP